MRKQAINYSDPKVRAEVLVRQRKGLWTPEQIQSFAGHFKLKPGIKFLDVGCGFGYIFQAYGTYCIPRSMLIGLDIETKLLRTARKKSAKEEFGRFTHLAAGDVYKLPFAKNSFDISTAHVLFCHLKEPQQALDELIRVTRRGGCIAIFDNVVADIGAGGWSNLLRLTTKHRISNYEHRLYMMRGRKMLGRGDIQVGCHIAYWMEKRGLKNVDIRCNERVSWIAPPYRSPAQKLEHHKLKARLAEPYDTTTKEYKDALDVLRKGGMDEKAIRKEIRRGKAHDKKFRKMFRRGTLAYAASSGQFWCTWGFKP